MTALNTWFAAAASNTAASPNGFPEAMLPSGLNNSFREVMAAIALGTPNWFSTVAAMRAITVNPGSTKRFALLEASLLVPLAWYQWLDTRTGSDNGTTIISPTASSLTAGAFEQVAYKPGGSSVDFSGVAGTSLTMVAVASRPAFINIGNTGADVTLLDVLGNYAGEALSIGITNNTFRVMTNGNIRGNRGVQVRPPIGSIFRVEPSIGGAGGGSIRYDLCAASPATSATVSIVSNIITLSADVTGRNVFIKYLDTQGALASDTLDTITLLSGTAITGSLLILKAVNDARTVIVTTAGNIDLNGSVSFSLDSQYDTLMLVYGASTARWKQVMGSNNGA